MSRKYKNSTAIQVSYIFKNFKINFNLIIINLFRPTKFLGEHYHIRKPLGLKEININNRENNKDELLPTPTTTKSTPNIFSIKENLSNTPTPESKINIIPSIDGSNITIEQNEIPLKNCNKPAILELPSDGFTRKERQQGWIIIHLLLACYFFWLLATICDDYFVPAIEAMCCSKLFFSIFFFFIILLKKKQNSFIQTKYCE